MKADEELLQKDMIYMSKVKSPKGTIIRLLPVIEEHLKLKMKRV